MAVPLSGRTIFLASPSGLDSARTFARDVIAEFNALHGYRQGVAFIVIGSDDLPAGLGRPQARINPYIVESDYLLMLVADRMGSPTTPTPPYRTGIEEELAVAAQACANPDSPMIDMLLLFRTPTDGELLNPSVDLALVQAFRHDIEASKELSYHPFNSEEELRRKLTVQLQDWTRPPSTKQPVSYPRLLAALDRTEQHPMATPASNQPDDLVQWAEAQANDGFITTAESAFARAAAHGRPRDLLRYARFLQRTGQLERAYELDSRILELDSVAGQDSAEAVGYRAAAMANMGLIRRKQGDVTTSKSLLVEAVETALSKGDELRNPLIYALDQLGITETRLGDLGAATNAYQKALVLRQEANDREGETQSLVNLARLSRQRGDVDYAVAQLEQAIGLLADLPESRLSANAQAALGQLLADRDATRARDLLDQALVINERLQIPDGISVTANGLALLALRHGDIPGAMKHASRVLDVSNETGNREGVAIALRLLGQVHLEAGELGKALDELRQSADMARAQHDPAREAAARYWLARALLASGDKDAASNEARQALDLAASASDRPTEDSLRRLLDELA